MKDKLKKVFTNKEFWTALVGCLGLLLSIALSYFSGFKDGILIDNTIRTELIEKAVDDAKNNKKQAINTGDSSPLPINTGDKVYIVDWLQYCLKGWQNTTNLRSQHSMVEDLGTNIYYLYHEYDNNFNTGTSSYEHYFRFYFLSFNFSNINTDTQSTGIMALTQCNYYTSDFITFSSAGQTILGTTSSTGNASTRNWFTQNVKTIYDYNLDIYDIDFPNINELYLATESVRDAVMYELAMNYGLTCSELIVSGASEEELENAYSSGYETGFTDGYNDRKNSVEDTEQKVNSIWTILEKAITSVLNVLSFEILPGMPLYICIGVPILLAVLLWFIKMGQS